MLTLIFLVKEKTMDNFEHVLPPKVGQVEAIGIGFPRTVPGKLTERSNIQEGLY